MFTEDYTANIPKKNLSKEEEKTIRDARLTHYITNWILDPIVYTFSAGLVFGAIFLYSPSSKSPPINNTCDDFQNPFYPSEKYTPPIPPYNPYPIPENQNNSYPLV